VNTGALERATESVLTGGLVLSGALLLGGLLTGAPAALHAGVIILMLTPVARVLVLTVGLLQERDWLFGAVSFFVLSVLASGIAVAFKL
jgi:uncharacterized membrane protein